MKPSKQLLAALFTCLCFIQCNCNKDVDKPKPDNPYGLPNATQTGAGVFACRINGVNAIAKNDIRHQGGGVHGDTLGVFGQFTVGHFFDLISLGLYNDIKTNTTYNLNDSLHTYCLFGTDSTCSAIGEVTNIYPKIGTFIITKLDTTHPTSTTNIISGIFNFKVPIADCDTLNITDGRFDINF